MKSNKEHQAEYKARQIALGYVRRAYFATPLEHEFIKAELSAFRLRTARKLANETK